MTSPDYDSLLANSAFRNQLLIELETNREAMRLIHATFWALNPLSALNLALFGAMYCFCHKYIMIPNVQGVIDSRRCALYAIVPSIVLSIKLRSPLAKPYVPMLL
jgi:hypothetical protein